jgi:hypothetical protein
MLGSFFSAVIAKIAALVAWFSALAVAVFVSFWDIFKDVFSWVFEQMMTVSTSAVGSIDVSAMSGYSAQGWGAITGPIVNILGLLGVGTAITIIASAISIRLVLQLIPFVRLGS